MNRAAPPPDRALPFLWHYVRRRPGGFGALFATVVGAAACAVLVQWGMKLLVDAMAAPDRAHADVWTPLYLFIGLIALENALWRGAGWLGCRAIVGAGVDMRLDLYEHLSGHAMRFFGHQFSGALGSRVTATTGASTQILSTLTWNILPPCTDFLGAVIVLSTIDGRMAGALVVFVAIVAIGIAAMGLRGAPLHRAFAEQAARVNGELVDVLVNIWTVKAYSARARERERLAQSFGTEAVAQRRSWMYVEKARVLHDLLLVTMAGGILVWSLSLWRSGQITPGDVVIVSAMTFRILHGSRDLALAWVGMSQHVSAIAESLRVIVQPHALLDPAHGRPHVPAGGQLEFRHVRYAYDDGAPVLTDFDLVIPAGQRVGIVGTSGAGKSTLVSLIQRLDDVQGGCILLDGQPLSEVTQDSLRDAISVVPQDITLFHRSLRENIRYGRPDASDEEVLQAARDAYCDEFVSGLPQGYDTLVGERGMRLSGGQRQRVAIARAFLRRSPLLVFDEATSALDSATERLIQDALVRLAQGRTVIAVAHRLSTVTSFDRIVVLEHGRIVEDGSPAELRARGGVFGQLWQLQAQGEQRRPRAA